jgi:hypothetical protein
MCGRRHGQRVQPFADRTRARVRSERPPVRRALAWRALPRRRPVLHRLACSAPRAARAVVGGRAGGDQRGGNRGRPCQRTAARGGPLARAAAALRDRHGIRRHRCRGRQRLGARPALRLRRAVRLHVLQPAPRAGAGRVRGRLLRGSPDGRRAARRAGRAAVRRLPRPLDHRARRNAHGGWAIADGRNVAARQLGAAAAVVRGGADRRGGCRP